MDIFSERWTKKWVDLLNADPEYTTYIGDWNYPMVFEIQHYPDLMGNVTRYILLEIGDQRIKYYEVSNTDLSGKGQYVFTASYEKFSEVILEGKDPLLNVMNGNLKLSKGNVFVLARYGKAGKRLLSVAQQVNKDEGIQLHVPQEEAATEPEHPSPAQTPQGHTSFKTTTGGLDFNSFPLRLFQKSKKLGIWDPASISFDQDVRDLTSLTEQEVTLLMHLTSMFVAGEESVTGDILPLMRAMAKRGWIEEELYLTSFAWEEAKHTEFFSIFLQQVMQTNQDLSHFHSPSYRAIFYDALPKAMEHVLYDHSDAAIAKASTTYNLIVEGTLAETGYHAYYTMLERHNIMPGLREGIGHLKRDEARHIAFGVYLLCRLCAQNTSVFAVIEEQMNTLIEPAIDFINEIFDDYEEMPFGLKREDFIEYALSQFRKRIAKIERATEQGYENLLLDTID